MIKFKNSVGYTVYRVTAEECYFWGGLSICDDCNEFSSYGYLVPVLNYFMCPSCFCEWDESCVFYPEDLDFESSVIKYYESILPVFDSHKVL